MINYTVIRRKLEVHYEINLSTLDVPTRRDEVEGKQKMSLSLILLNKLLKYSHANHNLYKTIDLNIKPLHHKKVKFLPNI